MRINTWAPAHAFFSSPYEAANFEVDLQRLGKMVRGTLEPGPSRIITNATHHDLAELVRLGLPLAVDIETSAGPGMGSWTGKDPTRCGLKCIGFGTCQTGISMMWEEMTDTDRLLVAEVLMDPAILKVLQNGPFFDIRVLARFGMKVVNFKDTRDMRRALVSTSKLSLSYMTSIYTDFPAWKLVSDSEEKIAAEVDEVAAEEESEDAHAEPALEGKLWQTNDVEKLMRYNALDCVATARVYRGLVADMKEAT